MTADLDTRAGEVYAPMGEVLPFRRRGVARCVQNHLAAVYDKTVRRTRAGAAVFAVEHGLI